ncbi:hypothetical protein LIA77_10935 [Sarocladium implicatum]|nr:hypothetical protein LIA77_10935 [Sarocladium implicatum]
MHGRATYDDDDGAALRERENARAHPFSACIFATFRCKCRLSGANARTLLGVTFTQPLDSLAPCTREQYIIPCDSEDRDSSNEETHASGLLRGGLTFCSSVCGQTFS